MGRLKGQSCYLSGSIDKSPDLGFGWRELITPRLKDYGCTVFNPLKKPIRIACETEFRAERAELKRAKKYEKLAKYVRYIRHVDLRLCDKSDFMIAYLDNDIQANGTYEEIFLINRQYKPCLLVCKQGVECIGDWFFGVFPTQFFFGSFDEMFDYLDYVNSSDDEDFSDLGRWVFFND